MQYLTPTADEPRINGFESTELERSCHGMWTKKAHVNFRYHVRPSREIARRIAHVLGGHKQQRSRTGKAADFTEKTDRIWDVFNDFNGRDYIKKSGAFR